MNISACTDLYLGDVARRCAQRTVDKYTWVLDKFVDHLGREYPVNEVSSEQCLAFLNHWNAKAPKTKGSMYTPLNQMFTFALRMDYTSKNPMSKIAYPKVPAPEDRGVKSISFKDVQKVMGECQTWTEKLCLGVLVYMGVRRAAANNLRWKDVDLEEGYIRFREKGGKYIRKPIPRPLWELLNAALMEGANIGGTQGIAGASRGPQGVLDGNASSSPSVSADDYVIPSEGPTHSPHRNDRFIWRVVKRVCARAGVDAHCHAFRAAFAVHYLESYDGDTIGLQNLMGHSQIATTQGYWRRLNKERSMEKVRELDWGVSLTEGEWPSPAGASSGSLVNFGKTKSEKSTREDSDSSSSPSVSEDDLISHIDEAKQHSDSMTPVRLRGKDSNLDSPTTGKLSASPRKQAGEERRESSHMTRKTTLDDTEKTCWR